MTRSIGSSHHGSYIVNIRHGSCWVEMTTKLIVDERTECAEVVLEICSDDTSVRIDTILRRDLNP
jgi:hypothetical protein